MLDLRADGKQTVRKEEVMIVATKRTAHSKRPRKDQAVSKASSTVQAAIAANLAALAGVKAA